MHSESRINRRWRQIEDLNEGKGRILSTWAVAKTTFNSAGMGTLGGELELSRECVKSEMSQTSSDRKC